jgi:hypothetical protein
MIGGCGAIPEKTIAPAFAKDPSNNNDKHARYPEWKNERIASVKRLDSTPRSESWLSGNSGF